MRVRALAQEAKNIPQSILRDVFYEPIALLEGIASVHLV